MPEPVLPTNNILKSLSFVFEIKAKGSFLKNKVKK